MISHDVLVMGSGPAGCSAALLLAHSGLNILMVTADADAGTMEASAPGPLESIHPGVSSLLYKINAGGAEGPAIASRYEGIYAGGVFSPLGQDDSGVWQGMHIHRSIFNAQLLDRVRKAGVEIRQAERIDDLILEDGKVAGVKIGSQKVKAKYVVDASGHKAIGGRKLKFKRQFFSPPLICWTGTSNITGSFPLEEKAAYFIPGHTGWTWLAPHPPHHCAWTRLSLKGEKQLSPPEELNTCPVVGKVQFANMRWRLYRPVCTEGLLLCGDAAGILDPAAGQGIFNALWSGMEVAETVKACLHHPGLASFYLAKYDDWFVQQFDMKVRQLRQYYKEHGLTM